VLLFAVVLSAAVAATPLIAQDGEIPNPLAGPGAESLKRSQEKKVARAWRELTNGDVEESAKRISRARPGAAADLVRLQILLAQENAEASARLESFCNDHPGYAAAWLTLSLAAEKDGNEALAIEAARRVSSLWPSSPMAGRADDLYTLWVNGRITDAEDLLERGLPDEAITTLKAALALDPERDDIVLEIAEILVGMDDLEGAEAVLAEIGGRPDAIFLLGRIAEIRRRWQSAMELYTSLPKGFPGREESISRAQTRWRLTLLPAYARVAMDSKELTRSQLAVLLVSSQPRLKTLPGGDVPVMSDIVDEPGQRDIITVVRLGIMRADRRGHVFRPNEIVDAQTAAKAVDRTRILLGLPPCRWCPDLNVVGSDCHSIPSPADGDAVVRAMLDSTTGADQ
jgi:tetratricopeptide (TPR) repeat protein